MKKVIKFPLILFVISFAILFALPIGSDFVQRELSSFRAPSSEKNCADVIASFYSKERNSLLNTRLINAKDDLHLFYRSFPPLFYKMADELKWQDQFKSVAKTASVMAGDSHMENFGLRFYKGQLRLSVNDYDDLTQGPVFLDVLRLFGSANLAGVEIDEALIEDVLKSYRKGLKNKEWSYSESIDELFKKSAKSNALDKKYVDQSAKKFLARKTPSSDIESNDLAKWTEVFKDIGTIKDSYLFIKQNGGSAGLKRFQFLIETDGRLAWIEAKEWSTPSFNAATKNTAPSELKRLEMITTYDQPEFSPELAKVNGKTFFLRQIDDRQKGVSLADLNTKKMGDILNDEAYALGIFHRTFLSDPKTFENSVDHDVMASDIKSFVEALTQKMKEAQKSL